MQPYIYFSAAAATLLLGEEFIVTQLIVGIIIFSGLYISRYRKPLIGSSSGYNRYQRVRAYRHVESGELVKKAENKERNINK